MWTFVTTAVSWILRQRSTTKWHGHLCPSPGSSTDPPVCTGPSRSPSRRNHPVGDRRQGGAVAVKPLSPAYPTRAYRVRVSKIRNCEGGDRPTKAEAACCLVADRRTVGELFSVFDYTKIGNLLVFLKGSAGQCGHALSRANAHRNECHELEQRLRNKLSRMPRLYRVF